MFHWPLSELEQMSIGDLVFWNDKAVSWWNRTRAKGTK
ncbi:conserved hypothetical protein [Erythrobacter sp. EC-HK427]|nr:conserved hypothetical protein [Erythrobacter sp. EC-HK427]